MPFGPTPVAGASGVKSIVFTLVWYVLSTRSSPRRRIRANIGTDAAWGPPLCWRTSRAETGASHPPQDEAEFTQNLFLTLRSARQRVSRRARPRRCHCDRSVMLAPTSVCAVDVLDGGTVNGGSALQCAPSS